MKIEKLKTRHTRLKTWMLILFIFGIVGLITTILLAIFIEPMAFNAIPAFIFVFIVTLLLFIGSRNCKCLTYIVNEHTFNVCTGLSVCYLLMDNEIIDKVGANQSAGFGDLTYRFNGIEIYVKIDNMRHVIFKANDQTIGDGKSVSIEPIHNDQVVYIKEEKNTLTLARELEELKSLLDKGIISEVNYNVLKDDLIKKHSMKK